MAITTKKQEMLERWCTEPPIMPSWLRWTNKAGEVEKTRSVAHVENNEAETLRACLEDALARVEKAERDLELSQLARK